MEGTQFNWSSFLINFIPENKPNEYLDSVNGFKNKLVKFLKKGILFVSEKNKLSTRSDVLCNKEEFSEFLNTEKFNSNQIELINLIIENILKHGAYSKNEIPKLSNDILGKSIFNIFTNCLSATDISATLSKGFSFIPNSFIN